MKETKLNDPGQAVVELKRASARLQEICAHPKLSQSELEEVQELSKLTVRAASAVLVWAEGVVDCDT